MADNEKDIAELIRKFQSQSSHMGMGGMKTGGDMSFLGNNPVLGEGAGVDRHAGIDNQGSGMPSQPINPGQISTSSGPSPVPVQDGCPQCGMIHPPLRPGERCPNAGAKTKSADGTEKVVDVNKYLMTLRNILMSQIDSKGIKDVDKLFKNITLEITKYLEGYKE